MLFQQSMFLCENIDFWSAHKNGSGVDLYIQAQQQQKQNKKTILFSILFRLCCSPVNCTYLLCGAMHRLVSHMCIVYMKIHRKLFHRTSCSSSSSDYLFLLFCFVLLFDTRKFIALLSCWTDRVHFVTFVQCQSSYTYGVGVGV